MTTVHISKTKNDSNEIQMGEKNKNQSAIETNTNTQGERPGPTEQVDPLFELEESPEKLRKSRKHECTQAETKLWIVLRF